MIYIVANAFAILAATLAGLLLGALWWRVFGDRTVPSAASLPFVIVSFVAEFWLASILAGALILAPPQAGLWVMTIATPIVIWIGFVLPAFVVALGRRRASIGSIAVETGHWLRVMLLQAIVLQAIGLSNPAG